MANSQNNNRGQNLTREARSKGGRNSPTNFRNNRALASRAGRIGGQSRGNRNNAASGDNEGNM